MNEGKAASIQTETAGTPQVTPSGQARPWRIPGRLAAMHVVIILLCALFPAVLPKSHAAIGSALEEPAVTENEVKALYVYYFAKFIDWPSDTFPTKNSPITIGVIGDDRVGALLGNIAKSKTIQEHPIVIRNMKWPVDPRACHLVYISSSEQKRFSQLIESLQSHPVLTITEAEENLQAKGIMNLFVEGGKVQFEVDLTRAQKANLQISSKLLRLARGVTGKTLVGKAE
jgi:hypothetical protein